MLGAVNSGYDALNRVTSETGNGLSYGYVYDSADVGTGGAFHSANPIGRLVEASNDVNASEQFSYDSMGRIIYEANCIPTNCTQTGNAVYASYDYAGDLTSLTYPDGRVVTMGFDSARHLTDAEYTGWNGQSQSTYYLNAASYDPTGAMTAATYGNGVQMTASFNSRQDITAVSYAYSGEALWSEQYTWANNAKNLEQITDEVAGNNSSFTYDTDNRLTAFSEGNTVKSPATPSTGWVSISGSEQSAYPCQTYCPLVYDSGEISVSVGGTYAGETSWGEGSTVYTLASGLATSINDNSSSPVTATASGSSVTLTSKATGTAANSLTIDVQVDWNDPTNAGVPLFSSSSFSASSSGSMSGGTNAVYGALYAETYSPDAWGNAQESGNFNFTQGFTADNQVSGYSYDSAGDVLSDGINSYTWNVNGTLAGTESGQYTYDALEQRVEKTGGSSPGEFIYFNGIPVAVLNTSAGTWTDLIWAGGSMIAEVAGSETAAPVYRLLDNQGSLIGTTGSSGTMTGTLTYGPYGQVMASSTSNPFSYAGLYQDTEYGGDHAWYRNLSTEQICWLSPDPSNKSYDLMDPQSLNRYAYVENNPLGNTDPRGLSFASDTCSLIPTFLLSGGGTSTKDLNNATALVGYASQLQKSSCSGSMEALAKFAAEHIIASGLAQYGNSSAAYFADIGAAITIACSIDYTKTACGSPQLAWLIPGAGGDVGLAVNDSISVAGAICAAAAPTGGAGAAVCLGVGLYKLANAIYQFLYSAFGWGPPQFTGSLLPRPGDLGGLGTAPIGIPNQNLNVRRLMGLRTQSPVLSPTPMVQ